eukprot:18703-Prorocentrum_minimum.AAC.8
MVDMTAATKRYEQDALAALSDGAATKLHVLNLHPPFVSLPAAAATPPTSLRGAAAWQTVCGGQGGGAHGLQEWAQTGAGGHQHRGGALVKHLPSKHTLCTLGLNHFCVTVNAVRCRFEPVDGERRLP